MRRILLQFTRHVKKLRQLQYREAGKPRKNYCWWNFGGVDYNIPPTNKEIRKLSCCKGRRPKIRVHNSVPVRAASKRKGPGLSTETKECATDSKGPVCSGEDMRGAIWVHANNRTTGGEPKNEKKGE